MADLLDKVIEEDEPRVKQLLGVGVNPDALIDHANPCSRIRQILDGTSALTIAISNGNIPIARPSSMRGRATGVARGECARRAAAISRFF